MLACLHAYMLTCFHSYILTFLQSYIMNTVIFDSVITSPVPEKDVILPAEEGSILQEDNLVYFGYFQKEMLTSTGNGKVYAWSMPS